jgi:hypothetical protein
LFLIFRQNYWHRSRFSEARFRSRRAQHLMCPLPFFLGPVFFQSTQPDRAVPFVSEIAS